jgi:hypothetical protein
VQLFLLFFSEDPAYAAITEKAFSETNKVIPAYEQVLGRLGLSGSF